MSDEAGAGGPHSSSSSTGAPGPDGSTRKATPPTEPAGTQTLSYPGAGRWARLAVAAAYAGAVVGPLAVVFAGSRPVGRSFGFELASALGIVGLTLLAMQFVLPSRVRSFSAPFGLDTILRFHVHVAKLAAVLVIAHVVVLIADDPHKVSLLDPLSAPWRARAGVLALIALLALLATSLARRRLGVPYESWRSSHLLLGTAVVLMSFTHGFGVDHYLGVPQVRIFVGVLALAGAAAVVYLRLARPLRSKLRPYRVERIVEQPGDARTLVLRADGHDGRRFRAGQFAWIKRGDWPLSLRENPFSFSSSAARPDMPEFTIKSLGDFTVDLGGLTHGDQVLLDGPHGRYLSSRGGVGIVFIVGGIGITPAMSVLRTAVDQGDRRPFLLFYGSIGPEQITFREELDQLASVLDLRIVHVLAKAPEDWNGERGFVTREILERHLPPDAHEYTFLVCGPPPMVEAIIPQLDALGIPRRRRHVEQFAMV